MSTDLGQYLAVVVDLEVVQKHHAELRVGRPPMPSMRVQSLRAESKTPGTGAALKPPATKSGVHSQPSRARGGRLGLGRTCGVGSGGPTRDSGRLLPEIAPKIAYSNLTRVLQRLGVAEDQARAGIDLGLRNRPLLDVETTGIHHVLAVPPVYRG